MSNDFFKDKADSYEQVTHRVANVENIARAVLGSANLKSGMNIMDFGSGTGLLLEQIAPAVTSITAVDISQSMNAQLEKKRADIKCELEIIEMDLTQSSLDRKFDGIISSMTMHHVDDIAAMFEKFHSMLDTGGFIAIADLVTEDGGFHTEDTGVFHFGFDPDEFLALASDAGFNNVELSVVSTVHKPLADYPVFLLSATA
ncbi:MAG: class I SAM-dependent methyltransferase [Pseudomonadales bacterium]|nr:class I SAM-dependent methyltransferase [Pseudomonadales bacterium]